MPTLSEDSPLDYDKLHPQGGEKVGLEPAVEIDRRGIPGASTEEVEMTAVLEHEIKVYIQTIDVHKRMSIFSWVCTLVKQAHSVLLYIYIHVELAYEIMVTDYKPCIITIISYSWRLCIINLSLLYSY